ncbi:hypothetical protein NDU88_001092 [Pleurodeles waltl]|uniref:Uncharacterized protein n=1 Tax=Pleurodeles waltl TaxID=8319 RepID=A0AAV7R9S1_PLEWA|nr:hypothetical protein NDU88_001092 [Pleurodeles waltl]
MRAASPTENPRISHCEEERKAGPFAQRRLGRSGPTRHSGVRRHATLLEEPCGTTGRAGTGLAGIGGPFVITWSAGDGRGTRGGYQEGPPHE